MRLRRGLRAQSVISYHSLNFVFSFLEPDLLALPDQVFPQVPQPHSLPSFFTFLLPQLGHLFFLASSRTPSCELHLAAIGTYPPSPVIGENLLRVTFEGWFLRPTLAEMFYLLRRGQCRFFFFGHFLCLLVFFLLFFSRFFLPFFDIFL